MIIGRLAGLPSLESQDKICREWCSHAGVDVERVFVDEGESAKTAQRTEFQNMLAYCRQNKGRIHYVVVYKVNRFARQNYDHHIVKALLGKLGISLRSATEYFDDSPVGKLTENMLAAFSQFDNDQRAENTVVGMRSALREGRWTFQAPLGYLNVTDGDGKPTIVPDPERGSLVRKAFELYSTGTQTKADVLRQLTALGLRTKWGKRVTAQTFDAVLRNPIYAGWLYVKKWDVHEQGSFEALVSQETFDQVQAVLDGKRVAVTPHVRNHPDFPLRVFVRCASCGRPLTGAWSTSRAKKKYAYYRCPNRHCKAVNVRKEVLERGFLALLEHLQPKPEFLALFRAIVADVWRRRQGDAAQTTRRLQETLEILTERKRRLLDLLIDGRVKQADYDEANDALSEEIAFAQMSIHEAKLEELDIEALVGFSEHILANAARLWFENALDRRQRLQKVLFPEGLRFSARDGFGTATTCSMFKWLNESVVEEVSLASPAGFEPALPP